MAKRKAAQAGGDFGMMRIWPKINHKLKNLAPAEPESQEASAEDVSGDLLSSIRKINRRKLKSKKTKKQKCQQWRSKIVIEEGKGKVEEGS